MTKGLYYVMLQVIESSGKFSKIGRILIVKTPRFFYRLNHYAPVNNEKRIEAVPKEP